MSIVPLYSEIDIHSLHGDKEYDAICDRIQKILQQPEHSKWFISSDIGVPYYSSARGGGNTSLVKQVIYDLLNELYLPTKLMKSKQSRYVRVYL